MKHQSTLIFLAGCLLLGAIFVVAEEALSENPPSYSLNLPLSYPILQHQPIRYNIPMVQRQPIMQQPMQPTYTLPQLQLQQPIALRQQPILQYPILQQPIMQQPIRYHIPQQILQHPIMQRPVLQHPIVQRPILQQQPIVQQPVVKPIVQQPIVQQPIVPQKSHPKPELKLKEERVHIQPIAKEEIVEQPIKQVEEVKEEHHEAIAVPQLKVTEPIKESKEAKLAAPSAPSECPAIEFSHKLHCGSDSCAVSFVNLSPAPLLHWVNVHLRSDSPSMLSLTGSADQSLQQLNFNMKLVAGTNAMKLAGESSSSPGHPAESDSAPLSSEQLEAAQQLLSSTGGSQVFSFALPLELKAGNLLGLSFTYCASGTDCDTSVFNYKLAEAEEAKPVKIKVTQPVMKSSKSHAELLAKQSNLELAQPQRLSLSSDHWSMQQPIGVGAAGENEENENRFEEL